MAGNGTLQKFMEAYEASELGCSGLCNSKVCDYRGMYHGGSSGAALVSVVVSCNLQVDLETLGFSVKGE